MEKFVKFIPTEELMKRYDYVYAVSFITNGEVDCFCFGCDKTYLEDTEVNRSHIENLVKIYLNRDSYIEQFTLSIIEMEEGFPIIRNLYQW